MKARIYFTILLLALCPAVTQAFSLYDLTCEQEENPVGIETQQPCFSWKIHATERGFVQSAYRILVADTPERLEQDQGNVWDSGKITSSRSVLTPYGGPALRSSTVYYWKVQSWDRAGRPSAWSVVRSFATGLLSESDWGRAVWIALEKDRSDEYIVPGLTNVRKGLDGRKTGFYQLPQFRKTFTLRKPVKQAMAYVAGLGQFDFFLNGEKVGRHFLDPGWTRYEKEALYVTFDVTQQLRTGENVLGMMLGNGFYNTPFERYLKLLISYGAPKMKLLLRLEYADGTVESVVSDTSWKAIESPVTCTSIDGGEVSDAGREEAGWLMTGYRDEAWAKALPAKYGGRLRSQRATPLTVRAELPTVTCYRNAKGNWLYDLGQNFSGIVRLEVRSDKARTVRLHPAELLNSDSTTNQSASGRPFYFSYTTRGDGETERWQPRFTYYGFRYVEVEGAVPTGSENPDGLPEIVSLTGLHTCNSAPETGSFTCSKPLFNRIHSLIDWAIRSNMASVLTDCPHREKLGWLEEAHLMQYSLQYRYNLSRLYAKVMNDMRTSQLENGCIPTIAPEYVRFANGFEDTPEWGSAFIICPWYVYRFYGDRRLLEEYYPDMQRYLEYLGTRAEGHIVAYGLGDWYDIGPKRPGYAQLTSNGVTATAIYYYNTTILQQVATLLGKSDDATRYEALAEEIRQAFLATFYDPSTGKIERNSQTASAMALYMGLVEGERREQVLQNLVEDIRSRNNALTAGDVGYRYVLRALETNGRSDVIFDMNSKYDVPGYGWQLAHGATALTESWQAYGFVSNNHFMLGHLMEWLYGGLGGIRQEAHSVAFREVLIDPQIVGDVHSAQTRYETPYGTIRCEWEVSEDDRYRICVTIPPNCTAKVALPTENPQQVTTYGLPLIASEDVRIAETAKEKLWLETGSGTYQFECQLRITNP
jgi:hypothetical protein